MRILLTGASGFVGRNVLLRAPVDWEIVALYSNDQSFPGFVSALNRPNFTACQVDLRSTQEITAAFARYGTDWDCCLYLAAKVDIPWSVQNPKDDLIFNTLSLLNLLETIKVDRFVYMSSGAVYDGLQGEVDSSCPVYPTLPYAISKLTSEEYVRTFCLRRKTIARHTIVRFFGAYGPYEASHKIYGRLVRRFGIERNSSYELYGDGSNLIDAMYIDDAVDALLLIANDPHDTTLDLAGGHPISIEELVRQAAQVFGITALRIQKSGIAHESNSFWGSTRGMYERYGYKTRVDLAEGLRRFRKFMLESS